MCRELGLDQDTLLGLSDHRSLDSLSELEKLALDYAVALSDTPAQVSDELYAALRGHLSEKQLVELQGAHAKLEAAGVRLVGVSYDDRTTLAKFAKKHGIAFPLLSDAGSETIEAWGIRNADVPYKMMEGVPHPGTWLLDRNGVVRARLAHQGYKERHSGEEILRAAQAPTP